MTKKELEQKLRGAWYAQRIYESELEKVQELRSLAQRTTPAYSQAPGGSGDGKALENAAIKIIEQEQVAARYCEELCEQLREVRALVALLPLGRERVVLHMRYLNYQKWKQIADELGYSEQYMYELHDKALTEIISKVNNKNKVVEH